MSLTSAALEDATIAVKKPAIQEAASMFAATLAALASVKSHLAPYRLDVLAVHLKTDGRFEVRANIQDMRTYAWTPLVVSGVHQHVETVVAGSGEPSFNWFTAEALVKRSLGGLISSTWCPEQLSVAEGIALLALAENSKILPQRLEIDAAGMWNFDALIGGRGVHATACSDGFSLLLDGFVLSEFQECRRAALHVYRAAVNEALRAVLAKRKCYPGIAVQ